MNRNTLTAAKELIIILLQGIGAGLLVGSVFVIAALWYAHWRF